MRQFVTRLLTASKEANNYIRHVQEQFYNLLQKSYRQEDLPPQFQQTLDRALKDITRDLGHLQGFVDRVATLGDNVKNKDNETETFQATTVEQAVEIQKLRNELDRVNLALSQSDKTNEDVQGTYQEVLVCLKEQNQELQKKLKVRARSVYIFDNRNNRLTCE